MSVSSLKSTRPRGCRSPKRAEAEVGRKPRGTMVVAASLTTVQQEKEK